MRSTAVSIGASIVAGFLCSGSWIRLRDGTPRRGRLEKCENGNFESAEWAGGL